MFTTTLAVTLGFKEIYLCFDDKTEVFTNSGWKLFKKLKENDLILTRKPDGKTEWSDIKNYYEYNYEGYMNHLKSKGIDLLVTPDHKFGINSSDNKEYLWQKVDEFKTTQGRYIPKTFKWKGKSKKYFILPKVTGKRFSKYNYHIPKKIIMEDWLQFLGLYLSEGSLGSEKDKGVIIYQNRNEKTEKEIGNILKKLPFNFNVYKRSWWIY